MLSRVAAASYVPAHHADPEVMCDAASLATQLRAAGAEHAHIRNIHTGGRERGGASKSRRQYVVKLRRLSLKNKKNESPGCSPGCKEVRLEKHNAVGIRLLFFNNVNNSSLHARTKKTTTQNWQSTCSKKHSPAGCAAK